MTSSLLPIFPAVYDVLFNFAQSDGFWANLAIAFGTSYDVVKATQLRQQWKSRNFSQLPSIEVLSDEVLGTANGAYSSSKNKIYLSASFLNTASPAAIVNVILEEIGHYVDAQINQVDSAGDEGAIFAELVRGNSLDVATLDALRAENDQTTIIINGEIIQVEQADFTGTPGNDNITGTSGDDNIYGLAGNDNLSGGSGNDQLYGGEGNDTLNGGTGNDNFGNWFYGREYIEQDQYIGGIGTDRLTFGSGDLGISLTYTDINAGTFSTGGTIKEIEELDFQGGIGNDNINASATTYVILKGGEGNDVLTGGSGNDELYGQVGNDNLQGTNSGTGERDTLEGGTGNDRFILADTTKTFYDDGNSTLPGDNDYATIADFSTTDDTIQLRGASSDYLLTVSGSNTNLYINKPGSEPDELIANISNQTALSLTASYFSYVSSPTLPSITLAVSPASVTEDGTANLIYTFTRTGVTTDALTVNYTVSGTATNGTDYASIPTSVTFAAGSATATVIVDPTADTTIESNETVILTLTAGTGYTVGTTTAVTGTITNVPATSVTPIEAFGNTKLVQDATNKLYAQIGNNNPTVIKNGATQITTNTYPGWQILAAETVNGINQVLLRNTSQNLLYIWNLDSNWSWQSSQGGWGLNSTQAFSQETNFQQDFNGDNQIGNPSTTLPSI
ncbi:Calx-beta domain-containing protein, partial [Microcystis aeruginosa]|uniref:Calx-beta domain-containing protein n=1 Tax=Microcystis aeruginosa TaxID=1126 RepID=UPI002648A136